jgi:hypothetical protein
MGILVIVTLSTCPPCIRFKKSGSLKELVSFLLENEPDLEIFWHELGTMTDDESYELTIEDEQLMKQRVEFDYDEVKPYVRQYPSGYYINDSGVVNQNQLSVNDPSQWNNLLEFIKQQ